MYRSTGSQWSAKWRSKGLERRRKIEELGLNGERGQDTWRCLMLSLTSRFSCFKWLKWSVDCIYIASLSLLRHSCLVFALPKDQMSNSVSRTVTSSFCPSVGEVYVSSLSFFWFIRGIFQCSCQQLPLNMTCMTSSLEQRVLGHLDMGFGFQLLKMLKTLLFCSSTAYLLLISYFNLLCFIQLWCWNV